jgi:hypothetical protein
MTLLVPADAPDKTAAQPSALGEMLVRRYERAKSAQTNWRSLWDFAARYVMPTKGGILSGVTPGQPLTDDIFDTTANESAFTLAAGLLTSLTPPNENWFRLVPRDDGDTELASWLDDCTERMSKLIVASNFKLAIHEAYSDLAAFSFEGLICEEISTVGKSPLNFINIPVGTFTVEEDAQAAIDTLFRSFDFTARQCAQQWGSEALPKDIRAALLSQDPSDADKKFRILHAIYPRKPDDVQEGLTVPQRRPWASVYVHIGDKSVIEESGYYERPHACGRLLRGNNEIYGRGPSDQSKPDIKMANRLSLNILLGIDESVNPHWLTGDPDFVPNNQPGSRMVWNAGMGAAGKPERLEFQGRLDVAQAKLDQHKDNIRRAFFVPMFQMLSNPEAAKKDMTAYEVSVRVQEKLLLFHPMFARIVQEILDPLLTRIFGVLLRRGYFPQPPEAFDAIDFEIDYISKIALAIREAQSHALVRMLELLGMIVQFDPSTGDIIDFHAAVRGSARNFGLPSSWQRSQEEVAQRAEANRQAALAQQLPAIADAAQKGSAAAKNLGPDAQAAMTEALGNAGDAAQ